MTSVNIKDKTKKNLLHKLRYDGSVSHLLPANEKYINERIDDFTATNSIYQPDAVEEFNKSLRRDIYASSNAEKAPKKLICRVLPGKVPDDAAHIETKKPQERSQDIVDFMFQKQEETRAHYREERKAAKEKASNRMLATYVPPPSLYKPPIQSYDKNRPYFQEYIRYRNELKPVVMPTFTHAEGSIRDRAKAAFMPKPDPNKVAKRDQIFADRAAKLLQEEKEAEQVKKTIRAKKQKESRRLREEQQWNVLASPIKSARPSTGLNSFRSPPSSSRPGTCNSFSPAALQTAFERPDYPTAGTIWLTDV